MTGQTGSRRHRQVKVTGGAPIGVVLSGGGARGAYEAGVLKGILETLNGSAGEPSPFQIISGTSVGALNGAWLAANAHSVDHGIDGLISLWKSLQLDRLLRIDAAALMGCRRVSPDYLGTSLMDPRALEKLVSRSLNWQSLHTNIETSRLRALVIAALHIGSGVTTLFTELAPGVEFRPSNNPRRTSKVTRIEARHVLASSALPGLLPARRIDGAFFADGGLRFNTPISPALRAGAEKLIVITLRHDPAVASTSTGEEQYPKFAFLAGKLLNALLLDPVAEDLETLEHINRLVAAQEIALSPKNISKLNMALEAMGHAPYKNIHTLHFQPSVNIGVLAGQFLRDGAARGAMRILRRLLLSRTGREHDSWESDLASYLLFDTEWATRLIELGRSDALIREREIRAFFSAPVSPKGPMR